MLGGSKVSDKLKVIEALLEVADELLIGGGMCFTFLKAQGHSVGASLCEDDQVATCKALLDRGAAIRLPSDVTALGPGGKIGDPGAGGDVRQLGTDVPDGWMGLDIGPGSAAEFGDVRARRPHRVLERARWACSRTRASRPAPAPWPRPWRSRTRSPWSAGETRPRRSPSSASPTASTTSAPAAVRRSSCSSRATSPASPPCERSRSLT